MPPTDDQPPEPDRTSPLRLGAVSRAWRVVVLTTVGALCLTGSLVGDDPWWPFGPWRMFSTSNPTTGAVVAMAIEVQTADDPAWRPEPLNPWSVGLNRAEVEGRIPQILHRPAMLGTLAASHHRLKPDDPAWTAVRLMRQETLIVDRRPTGEVRSTQLVAWRAS